MNQILGSHSAEIKMWLDCGSHGTIPLSRITPTMIVAKEPRAVPAGEAEIVVTVDGRYIRTKVMLNGGFAKGRTTARIWRIRDEVAPF